MTFAVISIVQATWRDRPRSAPMRSSSSSSRQCSAECARFFTFSFALCTKLQKCGTWPRWICAGTKHTSHGYTHSCTVYVRMRACGMADRYINSILARTHNTKQLCGLSYVSVLREKMQVAMLKNTRTKSQDFMPKYTRYGNNYCINILWTYVIGQRCRPSS